LTFGAETVVDYESRFVNVEVGRLGHIIIGTWLLGGSSDLFR